MLGIIVDVVAVLIIVIAATMAYKKGFVSTIFGLISTVLAVILAFVFYKDVATYINNNTGIDEWLNANISNIKIEQPKDTEKNDEPKENETSKNSISNAINGFINVDELKQNAVETVASNVSSIAVNILAWLIVYIVVRIVSSIVMHLLNTIMKLPILKQINNFAGLVIGAVMGFFRIYLLLLIIYFVNNIFDISAVINAITSSRFVCGMYYDNILLNLL